MRILVTGATGFVGRHVIPLLMPKHRVCCVARDIAKAKGLFGDNVEYIDTSSLNSIVNFEPEVVIHMAAFLSSKNDFETSDKLIESNIVFGSKLLCACQYCKTLKLFINFGTFAQYRSGADKIDDAYLYSATKTAFGALLDYYSQLGNYKYVNLIPYTIYGGVDSQKKIIDLVKDSMSSPSAIKMSEGKQVLDFIHVQDVAECVEYVADNVDKFVASTLVDYHLGTGKGTSIRELADLIEKKYGKKCNIEWGALPYRDRDVMCAIAPIEHLSYMGWTPKIDLVECL